MPKTVKEETTESEKEHIVRTFDYSDSDSSDEDIIEKEDDYDAYETEDEETEEYAEGLKKLLKEIADIDVLGLKVYRINFHDTRINNFKDINMETDFDRGEDDFPIMIDGGEDFIVPYLKEVSLIVPYYKDCTFETNVNLKFNL